MTYFITIVKNPGESEKAGMDLFRAIFKNTDSEDSSSDDEDEANDIPKEETANSVVTSQNADTVLGDNKMVKEDEVTKEMVSTSLHDSEASTSGEFMSLL